MSNNVRTACLALLLAARCIDAFSATAVDSNFSKLRQAFLSPAGKLTLFPEVVIPEPKDPTALLLMTNAVQTLSSRVRSCQANAAFVQGSLSALKTFTSEQESAMGSFPGPIPVIYCTNSMEIDDLKAKMGNIAEAGANGVLVSVNTQPLSSIEDVATQNKGWMDVCKSALDAGLQPIPEIIVFPKMAESWKEEDAQKLVETLAKCLGQDEAVACVLTVDNQETEQNDEGNADEVGAPPTVLAVPKSLSKKVPILGSVRATAGEGRLGMETTLLKDSGFTGAYLRSDCVPGFRLQLDLEIVSKFWEACITDLKSTRSKTFSFRSKNNMDMTNAEKWVRYRKSVLESGALGDPNENASIVDSAAGDYQGFA